METQSSFLTKLQELLQNPTTPLNDKNILSLTVDEQTLLKKLEDFVSTTSDPTKKPSNSTFIGFFGPLGVGKTTLASTLTTKLGAQFIIKEPYLSNPFWKFSQTDPSYMLRSQLYFLLANIETDIEATAQKGIAISDTSTLTDIVMWAQWYHEIGHLTHEEYDLYKQCVELLKPHIPRPTTLVTLIPDNVENLFQGIRQRQAAETGRKGELVFSTEELQTQIDRVIASAKKIENEWNTHVCKLVVDPSRIFLDTNLQAEYIESILSCLPEKENL